MDNLRQLLPSLNGLVVFEAAGRLSSFSAAARELGISQAAVSYAIGRLEDQLGLALFTRAFRKVHLTDAGIRFHGDVAMGLNHIQRSAASLRPGAGGSHVTLSCSTAFAAYWMVPRMQQFREELPGIDLRIHTADRDISLQAEGVALGIRGGVPSDWPRHGCAILAEEAIYPVCGANYAARLGDPPSAEELLTQPLIHLEEPHRTATTWAEWFGAGGIAEGRVPMGLRINDYVLVIQAVIEGQGIGLGWHHLVERLVAKGVLRRLGERPLLTGKNFYVIWPQDPPLSPAALAVRDWLAAQREPGARALQDPSGSHGTAL